MSASCWTRSLCAGVCIALGGPVAAQDVARVLSTSVPAQQPDSALRDPDLAGGGRHLVFATRAGNLVGGSVAAFQVLRLSFDDRSLGVLSRDPVSLEPADGSCLAPAASFDGRFVAFESTATNLLPAGPGQHVYRADALTGALLRVSRSPAGVAGNGPSRSASISADGRFVAFHTLATNLFSADTNARADVVLKDVETGNVELITRTSDGGLATESALPLTPYAMSADSRYVVFSTPAPNMVAGPGSAGGVAQVYVRDRIAGATQLVSRNGGAAADNVSDQSAISPNGRYIAFRSVAGNLGAVDSRVFVTDRNDGTLTSVPLPLATSFAPPLSASATVCREASVDDAGNVAMICNMAGGAPPQAFAWTRGSNALRLLSADLAGTNGLGNAISGNRVSMNDSGSAWALESQASNLVGDDTNGVADVFFPASLLPIFADGFE